MNTTSIFKIGNRDFTNNVIPGTYAVNLEDVAYTWQDGLMVTHKSVIRRRLVGEFDMFFKTAEEFHDFVNAIQNGTNSNNTIRVNLIANNDPNNALLSRHVFLNYEAVRNKDASGNDYFNQLTIGVEEQ